MSHSKHGVHKTQEFDVETGQLKDEVGLVRKEKNEQCRVQESGIKNHDITEVSVNAVSASAVAINVNVVSAIINAVAINVNVVSVNAVSANAVSVNAVFANVASNGDFLGVLVNARQEAN